MRIIENNANKNKAGFDQQPSKRKKIKPKIIVENMKEEAM